MWWIGFAAAQSGKIWSCFSRNSNFHDEHLGFEPTILIPQIFQWCTYTLWIFGNSLLITIVDFNYILNISYSLIHLIAMAWKLILFKVCAEYRDMLPRPRLVCQEPGLRPIGRIPGVPNKSSRGLGIMSRYSVQILICFIVSIISF